MENHEQMAKLSDFESFQFPQKRRICQVEAEESLIPEKINIKKKSCTSHQNNKKNDSNSCHKSLSPHISQAQGYKALI